MSTATLPLPDNRLAGLASRDVAERWDERGLSDATDAELVEWAAECIGVPRREPADSFVLHAPLELLARAALLPHVEPAARQAARQRIAWVAARFAESGPAFVPADGRPRSLAEAVYAGDLDAVDRAALALAHSTTAAELSEALAGAVLDRLGAAAHGAIFLHLLPRVLAGSPAAPAMARGLLRDLARHPDWRIHWIDGRRAGGSPSSDLVGRLLAPPSPGDPGSTFIYPTMSAVDRSGLAADLLDSATTGLAVPDARRDLLRVAAWSMLQDDPDQAPYGWSHCLTMPQATLGLAGRGADPDRAVAVAATYVLGFRSTLGRVRLDPDWGPTTDPAAGPDVLAHGPRPAAAAVWHAATGERAALVRQVVTYAALHEDAHLAKYVNACLEAARDDPAAARLFLAAAAHLAGWWRAKSVEPATVAALSVRA